MFQKNSYQQIHKKTTDKTELTELIHPLHQHQDPKTPYSLAHAYLPANKQSIPHQLTESLETFIFIKGNGIMVIEQEHQNVSKGSIVVVPKGKTQYLQNTGKTTLEFYCIVSPPWQQDNDKKVRK